jgi:hypothetical protein
MLFTADECIGNTCIADACTGDDELKGIALTDSQGKLT